VHKNTAIPGLDPLGDFTEKPPTEQVVVINEQRFWQAQWLKLARKFWKRKTYLASSTDGHKVGGVDSSAKPSWSIIERNVWIGIKTLIAMTVAVWYFSEGRDKDLSWLFLIPLAAFGIALVMVFYLRDIFR